MANYTDKELAYFDSMRVCILSPMAHVEHDWVQSTINMTAYSWQFSLRIYEMGKLSRMVVHWARNELAKMALEAICPTGEPYSHFLWLDTDHTFKPFLACQLARHMAEHEEIDAISALYYARSGKILPVAYVRDFSGDQYKHFPIVEVPEGLCEVDAAGFGAMLTKRKIFEAMPYPWFSFEHCGEDIYICAQSKKVGIRWFLDGAMKIGHVGEPPTINEDTYKKYLSEHSDELGERIRVRLGGVPDVSDMDERKTAESVL